MSRIRKYRYNGAPKTWNEFFTINDIYPEVEKYWTADYISLKSDNGEIMYPPKEFFTNVTLEVDKKFQEKIKTIIYCLVLIFLILISLREIAKLLKEIQ